MRTVTRSSTWAAVISARMPGQVEQDLDRLGAAGNAFVLGGAVVGLK